MNIFEHAVRQQLRFDFKGQISIEQLYFAYTSVKNKDKARTDFKDELISYEESLIKQLDSFGKTSRRQSVEKSKSQKEIELRLAIVSALLDEIDADEKIMTEKTDKDAKRQELLAIKAQKQAEALKGLSIEEIDKQLAAL